MLLINTIFLSFLFILFRCDSRQPEVLQNFNYNFWSPVVINEDLYFTIDFNYVIKKYENEIVIKSVKIADEYIPTYSSNQDPVDMISDGKNLYISSMNGHIKLRKYDFDLNLLEQYDISGSISLLKDQILIIYNNKYELGGGVWSLNKLNNTLNRVINFSEMDGTFPYYLRYSIEYEKMQQLAFLSSNDIFSFHTKHGNSYKKGQYRPFENLFNTFNKYYRIVSYSNNDCWILLSDLINIENNEIILQKYQFPEFQLINEYKFSCDGMVKFDVFLINHSLLCFIQGADGTTNLVKYHLRN